MITESKRKDHWLGFLPHKDCNVIIKLCFGREMRRKYIYDMQKLYKTLRFSTINKNRSEDLNEEPFEDIVNQVKKIAPLITKIMLSLRSNFNICLTSYLTLMKRLAVFVIMCRLAHQNNSNYIPFLIAIYFYSAEAKVDLITLLNCFRLSILYNLFLKKLKDIKAYSTVFINGKLPIISLLAHKTIIDIIRI